MEEIAFLLLTVVVELPVALLLMRKTSRLRMTWAVACVNMISHPLAWTQVSADTSWVKVEGGVVIAEMLFFALLFPESRKRAMAAAFLMNVLSAGVGALFFWGFTI